MIKYIAIVDGLEDDISSEFKKVNTYLKLHGTTDALFNCIAAILGVAYDIEETFGVSNEEMMFILHECFGYELISKTKVATQEIDLINLYDTWEAYAQVDEYSKQADSLVTDRLKAFVNSRIESIQTA